jgi:hypothetical protein|tara:strand:- start:859 stop:1236 length:378 start_codon:yes stop_codon:yes gene_type:complete
MKYRSNLERNIVRVLDKYKVPFEYEPDRLKYQPKIRTYIPDFYIPDGDFYIEGKGYFHTADERTRHLLIRDQLGVEVKFVFGNPDTYISKTSKTTYKEWCERYGFEQSGLNIPKKWFKQKKDGKK